MAHIITNERGESIDLDTADGQYRYVANALVQHGVHSQILGALGALYRDGQRIDWLADKSNTVGQVLLPREIVERNLTSMRGAIDAAMHKANPTDTGCGFTTAPTSASNTSAEELWGKDGSSRKKTRKPEN
jgi:hypothetical protein